MTADQMRLAAKILAGETIPSNNDGAEEEFERLYVSDSEDESFTEIEMNRQSRLQKANELIYNDSDDEHERQSISKNKKPTNEKDMFDVIEDGAEQMDQDNKQIEDEPMDDQNVGAAFESEEFNSQMIRQRLAELDDSDNESDDGMMNGMLNLSTFSSQILNKLF